MMTAKNLLKARLNDAVNRMGTFVTAEELVESFKKKGSLTESKRDEALEQQYVKYIKNGNVFSPVGNVTLAEKLDNCPFEIQLTPSGPVFERVKPNMDEVMVFENSPINGVVKEVDKFWSAKESYDKLGLLQNRGVLIYGPPGCGKSICLQQVVEMMCGRGDIVFFVKSPEAIIDGMKAFRSIEPERKVVVSFEEADEMFRYNERQMLRIMDGDAKINRVLFLATTNYPENLSPRCLRPGRFDSKIYVGPPSFEHRLQYLAKKLAKVNESPANIKHLAEQTNGLSFGHLRELVAGVYAVGKPLATVLKELRSGPQSFSQTPEKSSGRSL